MRVVTSQQMKQIEQNALQYDMTFYRLMENAGSAAAAFIRSTINVDGLNCMIFCSRGNNGGDGLVVARRLFENGANVLIVMVDGLPKSGEASSMYSMVELMSLPILDFEEKYSDILRYLENTDVVVDAIFGTGFSGELGTVYQKACAAINSAIAAVFSLDIPTGIACDTGTIDPYAVHADFTIVFDSLKPVHVNTTCTELCGSIQVVDIGIPEQARDGLGTRRRELTLEKVLECLPVRDPFSHKGSHGKVLCITGSTRFVGSSLLSTAAALRSGAGYVTTASIPAVCAAVVQNTPESILLPLSINSDGGISAGLGKDKLLDALKDCTCVLFGCGMGHTPDTALLLDLVASNAKCPIVVDADGINVLARNINILEGIDAPVIVTPHPGEMARLLGNTVDDVQSDRGGAALAFATEHKVITVLKGHETVIATPDGLVMTNPTGNAGLAKAGSGDVLAGIIASFAAQGLSPEDAAACGVFLHGLAADKTAARLSQYAMQPSDLLDDLCQIFGENGR